MQIKLPEDIKIESNASLGSVTTFQLGGPCKKLINCNSPQQIECAVKELSKQNIEFIVIGAGSNILASDKGLDKVIVRFVSDKPIIERSGNDIVASGSTLLDSVVRFAAAHLLEGINFATGIYGTVGGAICGNAGAYGKQVSDILVSVTLLDKSGNIREADPKTLGFNYRSSNLKNTGEIVLSASFSLKPGDKDKIEKELREILIARSKKLPDPASLPCAGSFFKNIKAEIPQKQNQSVGSLLEQSGAKNMSVGGAKVYEKHANIIIKSKNSCSAQDVYDLSKEMESAVRDKFNRSLTREVRLLGLFKNMPQGIKSDFW